MGTGFVVLIVGMTLAGIIAGIRIGIHIGTRRKISEETKGVLTMYRSDSKADPELFLTLMVPAKEVESQKHVLFEVHVMK